MKKTRYIAVAAILLIVFVCGSAFAACGGINIKKLPSEQTLSEELEKGGYELVFEDNFDGDSLDYTKWRAGYTSPYRRAGYYENSADTLFVKDGNLTIRTLYKDGQFGEGWYTSWVESASPQKGHTPLTVDNYTGFSQKYGYFEVRCMVPPSVGIWSAFWIMPDEGTGMTSQDVIGTGADGVEIDVMESPWMFQKGEKNVNVHVLHGDGYSNTKSQKSDSYLVPDMYTSFHTYGVMWTEKEYIFYVDGRETMRTNHVVNGETLGVSQVQQYMLLTVEVAGYADKDGNLHPGINEDGTPYWCGYPDENDKTKSYDFVIDYVRVYAQK